MKTGIRKAGIVGLAVIAIILFVCLFKNFGFRFISNRTRTNGKNTPAGRQITGK